MVWFVRMVHESPDNMKLCILMAIGFVAGNVVGDCPEPAPVVNAYRTLHGYTTGSVVEYRCYHSFDHRSGNLKRRCQADGNYNGEPPTCILDCGIPRNIVGTTKAYTTTDFMSTVTYSCLDNYTREDDVNYYQGSCITERETWSKGEYRCSAPGNLLEYGGTPYQSSGNVSMIDNLIDGDYATCTTTDAALTSSWSVIINNETLYDFNRIKIRFSNSTATPNNIYIAGFRTINWRKFKTCKPLTTGISTTDWLEVKCNAGSFGHGLFISATFDTPLPLALCEVQIYGRIRNVDCENTPFVYGAESSPTAAKLYNRSFYNCVDGFTHIGSNDNSICWVTGWRVAAFKCHDGYRANVSSDVTILTDNDNNTCQLMSVPLLSIKVNEPLELHSVTILGPTDWTDIEVSIGRSSLSVHQSNKSCQYDISHNKYLGNNRNKPWTFYCPQQPVADSMVVIIQSDLTNTVNICDVIVWGRPISQHYGVFECLQTSNGHDYKGNVNTTISGTVCQPWIHALNHINEFPDFNIAETNNYCRNPNGSRPSPWCYTSPDYNQWEYCPLLSCDTMCKTENDGSNYKGTKSLTIDGCTCIDWKSANQPFPPIMTENDYMNYCRNPGRSQSEPWCFISNSPTDNYKHCSIPDCPTNLSLGNLHLNISEISTPDYQFENCWQFIDENTIMELPALNIGRDIYDLCINNTTFVNLWCYNLDGGKQWFTVTLVCDDSLGFTNDETTPTLLSVTSGGENESTATITTSRSVTSTNESIISTAEGQSNSTVTTTESTISTETSGSSSPSTSKTSEVYTTDVQPNKKWDVYRNQKINGSNAKGYTKTRSSNSSSTEEQHYCSCRCINNNLLNTTSTDVKELADKINTALLVDIKTLSANTQKYISRNDNRTSVVYVGTGTVCLFIMPLLLLIMFDLLNLITFLKSKYR